MVKPVKDDEYEIVIAFRSRWIRNLTAEELKLFFEKIAACQNKINNKEKLIGAERFSMRQYALLRDLAYLLPCIDYLQDSHLPITGYTLANCVDKVKECAHVRDFFESANDFIEGDNQPPLTLEEFFDRLKGEVFDDEFNPSDKPK